MKKQPAIRYASGDPLYRWSFASVAGFPDQEARWLQDTTSSCGVKNIKSSEPQASSLKLDNGAGIV